MLKSEKGPKYIPITHIHDCSLSTVGTGTSIKGDGVNLVIWIRKTAIVTMVHIFASSDIHVFLRIEKFV